MAKHSQGKRLKKVRLQDVDREYFYALDEAVKLVKARHREVRRDHRDRDEPRRRPAHADQMVRGVVLAAERHRQDVRVAVFAKGDKAEKARRPVPTSSAPRT
jgi:large subunit ribosomal protein L1